jgi:hypothetical protein
MISPLPLGRSVEIATFSPVWIIVKLTILPSPASRLLRLTDLIMVDLMRLTMIGQAPRNDTGGKVTLIDYPRTLSRLRGGRLCPGGAFEKAFGAAYGFL